MIILFIFILFFFYKVCLNGYCIGIYLFGLIILYLEKYMNKSVYMYIFSLNYLYVCKRVVFCFDREVELVKKLF